MKSNTTMFQIGEGPVMALDIATIPDELKHRLIRVALHVNDLIGSGCIDAADDNKDASDAVDSLTEAAGEVVKLYAPVIPGTAPYTAEPLQAEYPVIRDGQVITIPLDEMSDIEIEATEWRLRCAADAAQRHATALAATASH